MSQKKLLRSLGEETIYSAKGHFKACDVRRTLMTWTIWACMLLNVLGLFIDQPLLNKLFSGFGIVGMIALLMWNEGKGADYRSQHKEVAERYLSLHKEVRAMYFLDKHDAKEIEKLSKKVSDFDSSSKPEIPTVAKYLAKRAIEKTGETDNWFVKGKS